MPFYLLHRSRCRRQLASWHWLVHQRSKCFVKVLTVRLLDLQPGRDSNPRSPVLMASWSNITQERLHYGCLPEVEVSLTNVWDALALHCWFHEQWHDNLPYNSIGMCVKGKSGAIGHVESLFFRTCWSTCLTVSGAAAWLLAALHALHTQRQIKRLQRLKVYRFSKFFSEKISFFA